MTASSPRSDRSSCHTYWACCPSTSRIAWYASASQLLPGKTRIPTFTGHLLVPRVASPGRAASGVSYDLVPVLLDQRVREKPVAHLPHAPLEPLVVVELDLEVAAGAHGLHPAVPERVEPLLNRLPRRVEHAGLQRHDDPHRPRRHAHASGSGRPTMRR